MKMRNPLMGTFLLLTATTVHAEAKPHEHGAMKVDVAIEGTRLTIDVEIPLDNLVGFERAPRTETERKSAAAALARMRAGADLFKANAEAQCALTSATVEAPVLEPEARSRPASEHADIDATYVFQCAQPAQLVTLDVSIFDAFRRVKRIDVQVAGPKGQAKVVLRPPARRVSLAK
jgi:Protein of unknown function (DUF2796)